MLIGVDNDEELNEDDLHVEEIVEDEEAEVINISLNSVVSITNPKTMKILDKVGKHELIVMIDPRATKNFISTLVVQRFGIQCEDCDKPGVLLGNGEEIVGKRVCRNVELVTQGLTLIQDFLSLDLGNSDLILGVQRLETMGPVTTNWKTDHEVRLARTESNVDWRPVLKTFKNFIKDNA